MQRLPQQQHLTGRLIIITTAIFPLFRQSVQVSADDFLQDYSVLGSAIRKPGVKCLFSIKIRHGPIVDPNLRSP